MVFRESTGLVLAVDQTPVYLYVKNPTLPLDKLGIEFKLIFDGVRQTGGVG